MAQQGDGLGLDLEGLLSSKVTSVRRKEESQSRASGALYVITQEQIRRFGITSVAEALRLVPGLHVARVNLNNWAVGSRGFNHPYSNKLLVMVDGRSVYSPMTGGAYWDSIDALIDDIDRIEVLRGPGATMWGANAVNGVINIITKPAQRTQGGMTTVGSGSLDRAITRLRYGGAAGGHGYWRAYTQNSYRVGQATFEPADGNGNWNLMQSGFRSDWTLSKTDTLTVQGDFFQGNAVTHVLTYQAGAPYANRRMDDQNTKGGNLVTSWEHQHRNGSTTLVRGYADLYERRDYINNFTTRAADVEMQHRLPAWRRHELTIGTGGRFTQADMIPGYFSYADSERRFGFGQATIQDDWELVPKRLATTLALRTEYNSLTGWNHQPTARLLYTPNEEQSLWGAWSRSVRVPAIGELAGSTTVRSYEPGRLGPINVVATMAANPGLRNENAESFEVGYRGQFRRRWLLDSAVFYSRARNLYGFQLQTPSFQAAPGAGGRPEMYLLLPLRYGASDMANTQGAEVSLRYAAGQKMQITVNHTYLNFSKVASRVPDPFADPRWLVAAAPRHQFSVQWQSRPAKRWEFDCYYFYSTRLIAQYSDTRNGAHHRADVRLGWRLGEGADLSAGMQNLIGGNRAEFEFRPGPSTSPMQPTAYLRFTTRF